jgi:dolichol kinase
MLKAIFFFNLALCTHRLLINLGHNMLLLIVLLGFRIFSIFMGFPFLCLLLVGSCSSNFDPM